MLAGYPIWWVLGAGALIWPLFSLPMLGRLVMRRRTVRVPRGFGWWLLFLVWMLLSFMQLQGDAPLPFLWRVGNYFSATITFVYVYNAPRDQLPARRIVELLAGFWLVTVAGGWLGVLRPYGEITSVVERLLPSELRRARVRPDPRAPGLRPGAGLPRLPAGPADRAVPLHERLGRGLRADHPVLHPRLAPGPQGLPPLRRAADPRDLAGPGVPLAQPGPVGQPPRRARLRRHPARRHRSAGPPVAARDPARRPRAHRLHAAEGGGRGPRREPAQQRGPRVPVRRDRRRRS